MGGYDEGGNWVDENNPSPLYTGTPANPWDLSSSATVQYGNGQPNQPAINEPRNYNTPQVEDTKIKLDTGAPPPAAPAPDPGSGGGSNPPGSLAAAFTPSSGPSYAPPAQGGSAFPGPTSGTPNLGDIWGQILGQARQSTQVDQNDPNFRQQADTFAASQERARRKANSGNAEEMNANFLGGSGAQALNERAINEHAAQNTGQFEATLVHSELQNKRDEIQKALSLAAGLGDSAAQRTLTQQLADLDAQLRREGFATQRYGIDANVGIANNQLGYNYAALEANQNDAALRTLLGE